jgi:DDE_Tnp_1-associated/Transposase DDE domain
LNPAPAGSLLEHLQQIPDPRGRQGLRHVFTAMLATVVCASWQGARGYLAFAQWIHAQDVALWHELGFQRKPPKLGAFRKLLMAIPPEQFEAAVRNWVRQCVGDPNPGEPLQPVSIDGKALRGTLKGLERVVHLLSILDQATGCTLSQTRVDDRTNEAKAALELLRTLVLKGRIVTGDAMFCQREVCEQILHQGGHYFFALKDNQPTLKEAVTAEFRAAFSPGERTPTRRAS